jgi:hypothetical protein
MMNVSKAMFVLGLTTAMFLGCAADTTDAPAPTGGGEKTPAEPAPSGSTPVSTAPSAGPSHGQVGGLAGPEAPSAPSATTLFADYWAEEPLPASTQTSFDLSTTSDLVVYVIFDNLEPGVYTGTLDFVAPGGGLYQSHHMAFAIGPTTETEVAIEGLLTPVPVQETTETDLGHRTTHLLPIAGTDIESHGLTGEWAVRVHLDDRSPEPLDSAVFTLTEESDAP